MYIYIHTYIYIYIYLCMYVCRQRERERERETSKRRLLERSKNVRRTSWNSASGTTGSLLL